MSKYTLDQVIQAMDAVILTIPNGRDDAAKNGQGGRYIRHGKPCCLVGAILARLGVPVPTMKELDREDKTIEESDHPYWNRFDPVARKLLDFLQRQSDNGRSWYVATTDAFSANRYWLREENRAYRWRAFPGPWCTEENVRHNY